MTKHRINSTEYNEELDYTGAEMADLFGININSFSSYVTAYAPMASIRRKTPCGRAIYNKSLVHQMIDNHGGIPTIIKKMRALRNAAFVKGQKRSRKSKPKPPQPKHYVIVGEPDGDSLAALMAAIASAPVIPYDCQI